MTQNIEADVPRLGHKEHRQAKYTIAIVCIHFRTIRTFYEYENSCFRYKRQNEYMS